LAVILLYAPGAATPPLPADHAEKMTRGQEVFTRHIRGLLVERCVKCHGRDKARGGLDLVSRETFLKGGDDGPVVVPFNAKASRLYRLAAHLEKPHMPPQGQGPRLTDEQLHHLAAWIDLGAPYDKPLLQKAGAKKPMTVTDEDRRFWSFRPLVRAPLPAVKNAAWVRMPVDRFILSALEAKGIGPNPQADRRTLIRRASFDLTGLPPTPEEVRDFLADTAADAYERLIDRLLASPHFGERWARHWLDLARFAESHGFEHDYDRPTAYPYRDFVIKAFNQDLPYDTFVKWQIAGDELEPDNPLALSATGFLAAGVHSTQITANQVEKERYDELDDILRTTGTAFLGLTIGCARCHDHKFDPIPTRDYYRLLCTFTTTVRTEVDLELDPHAGQQARVAFDTEQARLDAAVKEYEGRKGRGDARWKELNRLAEDHRRKRAAVGKTKALICSGGLPPVRLHTQGADFLEQTHFLKRGDPNQKEGVATQGFLQVLTRSPDGERHWQTAPPRGWRTSYRRRALAAWLTDVDRGAGHLLARVIVNRLWQHHMGRGIVGTPSDFGLQGERPTHPELLDFLAAELVANGWRLKPIHKLILCSAAYRQGGEYSKERAVVDVDNRLYWRRVPRRLEAEVIRDALLAVGGTLDRRFFGPGTLDPKHRRRSIYFFVKRSQLVPSMILFDAPDGLQGVEQRTTTTIAPQALLLMNNATVRGCAEALARRSAPGPAAPLADVIPSAYLFALARLPSEKEQTEAVQFLREQAASYRADGKADAEHLALADFCQVLLGSNELLYID
jgi:mono/diheme cytochrome c family protein